MKSSLKNRILTLLFASSLFATALIAVAALWIFERSVARTLDSHLAAYTDILVDELSIEGTVLKLNEQSSLLTNVPRHWQVSGDGEVLFRSENLAGEFPLIKETPGELIRLRYQEPGGKELIAVQNSYLFPGNRIVTLTFGIEREIAERYLKQERDYLRGYLYRVLLIVFLLLFAVALLVSHFATKPISSLRAAVAAVQTGKESRVQGKFPVEISMLTEEINRLLDSLSNALHRSRAFAADLSHSLKTPLTVIRNEPISPLVREKTDAILRLVDRNLARASAASTREIIGVRSEIKPVVERVLRGFSKIHPVETQIIGEDGLFFYGDEVDLFELLGNIIENACKFASSHVRVTIHQDAIVVEDDGVGIPPDKLGTVLERGSQLDTSGAGSGIGLAIAKDIVELYSGSIDLDSSELSGLKVTIQLPIGR